jgi:hypothetical protein
VTDEGTLHFESFDEFDGLQSVQYPNLEAAHLGAEGIGRAAAEKKLKRSLYPRRTQLLSALIKIEEDASRLSWLVPCAAIAP